jgi:hypothetical protein
MVAVGAAGLAWGRRRAVAFVLVGVSVFPFSQMWHVGSRSTNLPTLDGIRYVMESVAPTETVMDGWTGLGVFRPHAYFFFFLHEELRAMLTDDERRRLVEDLEAGRIAPKLVILDKDLRAVSDDLTRFVEERYEPVGRHDIWKRKGTTRELSLRTGEKVP